MSSYLAFGRVIARPGCHGVCWLDRKATPEHSSRAGLAPDDRRPVTGEQDEQETPDGADETDALRGKAASPLRVVSGPLPVVEQREEMPQVRLRREFKGLTIADLHRDEIVARLPGQARSALEHLENGDLQAAEAALPGQFAPLLEGPGHARRSRYWWFAVAAALAVVAGGLLASWLTF